MHSFFFFHSHFDYNCTSLSGVEYLALISSHSQKSLISHYPFLRVGHHGTSFLEYSNMRTSERLLLLGAITSHISVHASSPISKIGFTTIVPGGSYNPVTVTAQYQTIPSYVPSASTYTSYIWVSTVIADGDGKICTITKTEEPVTLYHIKSTITHITTATEWKSITPISGISSQGRNTTKNPMYTIGIRKELHETIAGIEFEFLGPSALTGYLGSGICGKECNGNDNTTYQPAHMSEFSEGKWRYYNTTFTYGIPTPRLTTYTTPGTYTVSEYDMTVRNTLTIPLEATFTALAGKTATYGGVITSVNKPCALTVHYGGHQIDGTTTKAIIKTTTVFASVPGYYTVIKPTTTKYANDTVCAYPTTRVYEPGIYHHSKETLTISESRAIHTCSYHQTSMYLAPATTLRHSTTSNNPQPSPLVSSNGGTLTVTPSGGYDVHRTGTPSETGDDMFGPTATKPSSADPSSDYEENDGAYEKLKVGYVKKGGMLKRRKAEEGENFQTVKRVILI